MFGIRLGKVSICNLNLNISKSRTMCSLHYTLCPKPYPERREERSWNNLISFALSNLNLSLVVLYFITGRNVTKALFYVHGFIHSASAQKKRHYIFPNYCRFGENSSLAVCKLSHVIVRFSL